MTNINPSQYTNSFISGYNAARLGGRINNSPNVQNEAQQQTANQENILRNILPKTMEQITQTTARLSIMNEQQITNLLKDLLNFPKNFDELINRLITGEQLSNRQMGILLLAAGADLSKFSSLLQTASKEALTNLYQMLAQYNQLGLSLKDEQIAEITKMITFAAAASASDVQSLKTTMLMYLPWLPLTNPDIFKLEIGKNGANEGSFSDDFISVLISTENYGNLQGDIYKTNQDGIKILLISSEDFPQKKLAELMNEERKKYSININYDFAVKEAFKKGKNEKPETQIYMNTSPGVNPFLLLVSNAFIKNVHIIDTKENLREKREGKLDGKS